MNEHLTLQIAELKEAVRRKFRQFKDGNVESERLLERRYKPIIRELKRVEPKTELKSEPVSVKKEEEEEKQEAEEEEPMDYESENENNYIGPSFRPESESTPNRLHEAVSSPSDLETASQYIEDQFENPLTQKYMKILLKDAGGNSRVIDHEYGPRYNSEGNTLMVGDKVLEFDSDGAIVINETKYRPSEGLYELLFKRLPNDEVYTNDDLQAYKNILNATNAHKKGYNFYSNIRRDNSLKYRHIIKDLFPTKQGRGMAWKSAKSRDLVHWDNPNELVDRLKLLTSSADSGNNSHGNEILNIVEELREAGYIRGAGNSRFKSFLTWA